MNIVTENCDWLGGWPMEFIQDIDARAFCEKPGFSLNKIKTGEAFTESAQHSAD